MKYAVLYEEKLSLDDGYGGTYIKKVPTYVEFDNQNELLEWINHGPHYTDPKSYKIIEFQPVEVKTKIEIVRPPVYRGLDPKSEYERARTVQGSKTGPVSTRLVN